MSNSMAKPIDFAITENGKIVDLTDEAHSIYNQIKRGDIEGVKIGAGTHKRLADVPFRITKGLVMKYQDMYCLFPILTPKK